MSHHLSLLSPQLCNVCDEIDMLMHDCDFFTMYGFVCYLVYIEYIDCLVTKITREFYWEGQYPTPSPMMAEVFMKLVLSLDRKQYHHTAWDKMANVFPISLVTAWVMNSSWIHHECIYEQKSDISEGQTVLKLNGSVLIVTNDRSVIQKNFYQKYKCKQTACEWTDDAE